MTTCKPSTKSSNDLVAKPLRSGFLTREPRSLNQKPGFRAECDWTAGTGLVFTYYASYDCLDYMRKSFPTAVASVPGGEAYEEVMKKVTDANEGSGLAVKACVGRALHP